RESDPNGQAMKPVWDILIAHHADVVINGHDHFYERFARQSSSGAADPNGLREFIIGTGGMDLNDRGRVAANSERFEKKYGVLILSLPPDAYDWMFLATTFPNLEPSIADHSASPEKCHAKQGFNARLPRGTKA